MHTSISLKTKITDSELDVVLTGKNRVFVILKAKIQISQNSNLLYYANSIDILSRQSACTF